MDQVVGVRSLHLNGQPLAQISPTESRHDIRLPGLLDRNQLDIEVNVAAANAQSDNPGTEWGMISLVIRSTEDGR